ncbi:MAG: ATP12 family protein [Alphaproteobacteria bacterium]
MKRFYTLVSTHKTDGGFEIHLDGRPVKTPMKATLIAGNNAIANALQSEWMAQEEEIKPDTMPLTQILSTQIDRIGAERETIQNTLLKYLDTDLVCYFTDEPPALKEAQEITLNPYLKWFETYFKTPLKTTTGLTAITQSEQAHKAVTDYVTALDDAHFTVLQLVSSLAGSLVLAMNAMEEGRTAPEIFTAMRIEENFKAEIYNEDFYGPDPAQEQKDNIIKAELKAALRYLDLL